MREYKIVELFSGIGSQAKAFERVAKKRGISFCVANTCEWDIHSIVAYDYIHHGGMILSDADKISDEAILSKLSSLSLSNDGKKKMEYKSLKAIPQDTRRRIYSSIIRTNNLINVEDVKGEQLPSDITLLTYSFPCQDLSNVGALHGYKSGIDRNANSRSGLLWEVERMLLERYKQGLDTPKFLLLENVNALDAKKNKINFDSWKSCLEKLGYKNVVYKLYAPDFGIPQNRRRLLMLSIHIGNSKAKRNKVERYLSKHDLNDKTYVESLGLQIKGDTIKSFLRLDMNNKQFLSEALEAQPNKTKSRLTIWNNNSQILKSNGEMTQIVQTITTKQDRHPNSGNLFFSRNNGKSKYRFLTTRECFLLMGFDEKDYDALIHNNCLARKDSLFFSRDRLYKLSGNSIVVNMLEAIFNQVIDIDEMLSK